jgi:hypothetical protein
MAWPASAILVRSSILPVLRGVEFVGFPLPGLRSLAVCPRSHETAEGSASDDAANEPCVTIFACVDDALGQHCKPRLKKDRKA